jgi:cyclomaltodextrinase
MSVPDWIYDAVIYQIFPDRFADGDAGNNPVNVQPWDSPPTIWGFQGGDLKGIIQRFDYLLDLGVTVVYLNPIFHATSNHRYNTSDYYRIDPKLGDMDDFQALVRLAHKNNIRVILDGVFNHCGRGFFAFNDLLENQEYSPYRDWFHVKHFPVEAYAPGPAQDYLAWWEIKSLPKFNTDNLQVRKYLLDVARYWILQGTDGWRLDVPNEINDDSFWSEFRGAVKEANPEAYLVGEIWMPDRRWVGEKTFDGLLNYPFRDDLIRFIHSGTLSAVEFADKVEALASFYPAENALAMYNLLGSHDTERVRTKLDGDLAKTKLAFFCQFSFPGVPGIYYGDELGLLGGKDPDCRAAFPWDESRWEHDLRDWVKQLIAIRKQQRALRRGDLKRVMVDQSNSAYAFLRGEGDEGVLVIINAGSKRQNVLIPKDSLPWGIGQQAQNLFNRQTTASDDRGMQVELEALSGVWMSRA